jgi:hypothetical protein
MMSQLVVFLFTFKDFITVAVYAKNFIGLIPEEDTLNNGKFLIMPDILGINRISSFC